jgi:DNA-directed RNA polymerase specialized sigma24 family protein
VEVTDRPDVDVRDADRRDVGARLEAKERADALWTAVDALPTRCHLLVRFLLLDPPASYEAIAEALEMPLGSVGPTRARCFDRLRASLVASGISAPPGGSA